MKNERFLSQGDAAALCRLAENLVHTCHAKFNPAEKLVDLIAACMLIPENDRRKRVVSLNSEVTYRTVGTQEICSMVIACPSDANEALAYVSILTPHAMALLGRRVGSIVEVGLPFNRIQYVEVVAVRSANQPSLPYAHAASRGKRAWAEVAS